MGMYGVGLWLSLLADVDGAASSAVLEEVAAPAAAEVEDLAGAFPSVAHYPPLTDSLRAALVRRDSSGVLRGLAETFAPARWADVSRWDRLAYIHLGAPGGYVVNRAGEPTALGPGRRDLGCSGALLEALRLLWLPRVELSELAACDPSGGVDCEGGAHFGRSMLRHIGSKLDAKWLAAGTGERRVPLQPRALRLRVGGQDELMLCAVSHKARKMKGRRYYHHMIVLDATNDARGRIHLFDTAGRSGVAYRPLRPAALVQYLRTTLARGNKKFSYAPRSAQLHCLGVHRPDRALGELAAALPVDAGSSTPRSAAARAAADAVGPAVGGVGDPLNLKVEATSTIWGQTSRGAR